MIWNMISALAAVLSTTAMVVTALYVRAQIVSLDKDRYIAVTNDLYTVWQSRDFMEAQLWLLHRLNVEDWQEFVRQHRADQGELYFHQVGSFYDRVGTLVRLKLINEKEILSTIGGHAIAVWNKIEDLVRDARRSENSGLFNDFEGLVPACYECYVPALGMQTEKRPPLPDASVPRISVQDLKKKLDSGEPVTVLDVRQPSHVEADPRSIPNSVTSPPDSIEARFRELPVDREVVAFCA
ncbi:MAG TPA: hypothetical protein VGS41_08110 [Chthonomonadales bacterium]|nr:hypothetical protein [Chthonomonadales bacterium]